MRIFALAAMVLWWNLGWCATYVVEDGGNVMLRSGKGENYRVIRALPAGSEVELISEDDPYARVQTRDGQKGWMPRRLLRSAPATEMAPAPTPAPPDPSAPAELESQLESLKSQLSNTQSRLEIEQQRSREYAILLIVVAAVALVVGALLGAVSLGAYYRKKLNGLRI